MTATDTGRDALSARLESGAQALALDLSAAQRAQLMDFLALLQKWNAVYNLTAVRDPGEMLTQHLLDSLAAVAPLRRHVHAAGLGAGGGMRPETVRLLDVGSGGGLPGVVFAICCPEVAVHCVDAVGKKAAFVQQAALTLGLRNVHGVHARVEALSARFDVVSCRAFASLPDFVRWSRTALAEPHGVWLAMKGRHPADEIAALPADVQVFHVEPLAVPGLDAERCIVWMRPAV
ncbi:16S rRNA (guanine(527)-N(7))-methyltransferase RsmG [Verminephrobacter aporrectodeae]|uniref:16S rRNA (guanine(527)-N(7))-methyltransferase RsmG n=1 Tax=Verminephrobacter aporrectodeae TaxID=1110389 RepID=UPI000237682C|nr:16S rRNA (guanine(527)-N(7))-methyltransferase RsmG [Verminephrobacter aporrectodeae]MCW5257185.1 16S rRNA (guanine(527)-N(7))-methyltransferase RsmG [Verminephrobacter aporrectodeae subsp. tuberculatae]MCW8163542.1 16S rRNA (guanine(527)-N(7))-methyltransferase RsmG [Verminephrobacter aporrectodeae subsp. tuberculatae]MCW8167737.1 16S rRNA (guanine(527)-N(7))-methyltransferase RsmG [Verminephrobacter aporrectodeae subsp. tuberculatae]MCW8175979.1 16S rRNA (guanine(527)-N(7))-methyltransfera